MGVVIVTPVKNRLGQLLLKPGGIRRQEALEEAGKNVESLRQEFVAAMPGEIAALEDLFTAASLSGNISAEMLDAMLRRAGQLLTLSGTYGYDLLDRVVKRFCDLAIGMIEKDISDIAPVSVHLRAMRLVCPGAPELGPVESDAMFAGLERLHRHYGITRIAEDDPVPEDQPA